MLLSNTANTITATTIRVGDSNGLNANLSHVLRLGTGTNVIAADTIDLALSKVATSTLGFAAQAAGSPGTVTIGGKSGATVNLVFGSKNGTSTSSTPTGLLELRGHTATVTAGTVTLGLSNDSNSGGALGTISMDAGTFTANSLAMGTKSSSGGGTAAGVINLGGGTFTINTSGTGTLGSNSGSGAGTGTLNLTGGTFTANCDLLDGGGTGTTTSTITINGGTLDMKGFKIGSASVLVDALNLQSGTLRNVVEINNGVAIAKTTTGTLTLAGTNTYTGATAVSAGTLLVTGTTAAASAFTVASTATLGGTGTVGGTVTVANGGTLAPGLAGTIGTLTTGTVSGGATSTYAVDLDGLSPSADLTTTAGTVTCTGTLTVTTATNAALGKVYTIITAGTVIGTYANLANGALFNAQSRTFQIAYGASTVTLTDVARPTTRVWDGGGGDNNWSTGANWDSDLVPSAGDDLQFAGTTRPAPNNDLTADTSFASITFNSGATGFTVGGNRITLTGNLTNSSAVTQTLGLPLLVNGATSVTAASGAIVSSGVISGTGALTSTGSGGLTLGVNNAFSGGVTVSQGTLSTGGTGCGTGAVTVAGSATLTVGGASGLLARYYNVDATSSNFNSLAALLAHLLAPQTIAWRTSPRP